MANAASPASEPAKARVVHHVPGRMRLKFERDVNVPETAERLRARMAEHPGIRSVESHPRTHSVVVHYDAAVLDVERLMDEGFPAAAVELLETGVVVVSHVASGTTVGRGVVNAVATANARLERATGGALDFRDLLPMTLSGFGARRLLQGGLQPVPWYNLIYWSYATFTQLHSQGPGHRYGAPEPDALEILRRRYARGEITRTQYRRMLGELERGAVETDEPPTSEEAMGDEGSPAAG